MGIQDMRTGTACMLEQRPPESSCQPSALPHVIHSDPHSPAANVRPPSHQCIPKGDQSSSQPPPPSRPLNRRRGSWLARDELSFLAASLINLSQNICSESWLLNSCFSLTKHFCIFITLFNHLPVLEGMQNRDFSSSVTGKGTEPHRGYAICPGFAACQQQHQDLRPNLLAGSWRGALFSTPVFSKTLPFVLNMSLSLCRD